MSRPTPDQLEAAAATFAREVEGWRMRQWGDGRLTICGPTMVGLQGLSARETAAMGTYLGEAINRNSGSLVRFYPPNADISDQLRRSAAVLDARATWEPADRRQPGRGPRLVLELVDPRDGAIAYTVTHLLPAALASRPSDHPGLPDPRQPRPDTRLPQPEPAPEPAAPAAERVGAGRPSSPPTGQAKPQPPSRTGVLRMEAPHGVVYLEGAKLIGRILLLDVQAGTLPGRELRVRFVMTSKRGTQEVKLRCEFFDEQGAPAGVVEDVDLKVPEGRSTSIAFASSRPATRYALYVRTD